MRFPGCCRNIERPGLGGGLPRVARSCGFLTRAAGSTSTAPLSLALRSMGEHGRLKTITNGVARVLDGSCLTGVLSSHHVKAGTAASRPMGVPAVHGARERLEGCRSRRSTCLTLMQGGPPRDKLKWSHLVR